MAVQVNVPALAMEEVNSTHKFFQMNISKYNMGIGSGLTELCNVFNE